MKLKRYDMVLVAVLAYAACGSVAAQDSGYLVRAGDLKQEPFDDSARVGQVTERAPVRILERQGAWMRVEAGSSTGWVRMLAVRVGSADGAPAGDSGMKAAFNVARTGASGQTVATGVRGLDKEDLRRAAPNAGQVTKMESYAANRPDAEAFAARAQTARPEPTKAGMGKAG